MGIWTHSLKFNVGTSGIHELPQTTGDGIHSLLRASCACCLSRPLPTRIIKSYFVTYIYIHYFHYDCFNITKPIAII